MHVITENEARNLAQRIERGGRMVVPAGTILTPMARDYLRSRGIEIEGERSGAAGDRSDEALVEAVAAEVARTLAGGSKPDVASVAKRVDDGIKARGVQQRAVVWGIGGDRPGILADVAELLGKRKINILEISQTILSGVFAMVMIVDVTHATGQFGELKAELEGLGKSLGINLSAQRDEIFQYMHRV